jgi:hypothetical protein
MLYPCSVALESCICHRKTKFIGEVLQVRVASHRQLDRAVRCVEEACACREPVRPAHATSRYS